MVKSFRCNLYLMEETSFTPHPFRITSARGKTILARTQAEWDRIHVPIILCPFSRMIN